MTGALPVDPQTQPTAASITAGLKTRDETADELRCSARTIIRYEHAGMPVIRLGMLRFYNPAAVREWLEGLEHRHDAPKRGRPRKAA
jgi:hypothetical protein